MIYFESPKRKKFWDTSSQPSTSTAKPNRFGKETVLGVRWDQNGVVYHALLNPGDAVKTIRYKQQMINLKNSFNESRMGQKTWRSNLTTRQCTDT